jgi:hypothetical protein
MVIKCAKFRHFRHSAFNPLPDKEKSPSAIITGHDEFRHAGDETSARYDETARDA